MLHMVAKILKIDFLFIETFGNCLTTTTKKWSLKYLDHKKFKCHKVWKMLCNRKIGLKMLNKMSLKQKNQIDAKKCSKDFCIWTQWWYMNEVLFLMYWSTEGKNTNATNS